ncbi:MAG: ComEC/Rec2 family competence protein [Thermoleophilaceae bacterium]
MIAVRAAIRAARRRRPHLLLAAVVAGLAASPFGAIWIAVTVAVAVAIAATAFGSRAVVAGALLVAAAAAVGTARIAAIDAPARAAPPGTAIQAIATLLERPRPTRFGSSAPMAIESGPARGLHVLARVDAAAWPTGVAEGLRVRLRGLVREPAGGGAHTGAVSPGEVDVRAGAKSVPTEANGGKPGTPGFGPLPRRGDDFDYAAFLRSRGIGRELKVEWMRSVGRRGGAAGVVDRVRDRAERAIAAGLPADQAALARGMVLGEDGDIPDAQRQDFQRSGLAHLLAASGQNVMLLCALALPLLMLAGAGPRVRVAVLLVLVALYAPLAGSGASVERAGVMAAAGLVAMAVGRPASATYALLLAAAVTLAANPRASGDPGWQLSFAAVGGMLVLGPYVRRPLGRLPRPLAEGLAATIAATLSTAPLMAHLFGAVSVAALPANLVALPAVAPIMWTGMAEAAVAQIGALGHAPAAAADALCALAGRAAGLGVRWVAATARRFADPEWAQAHVRLGWGGVAAAYATLATAVALLRRGPASRAGDLLDAWRAVPARSRRAAVVLAAALAAGAASASALAPVAPRRLTIDYLDVGQGDATLIRDAAGAAVLFDGGPPEARVDRLLHRIGVRRLDLVVATHQSRDHHGGLLQVVRRFPVGLFLDGGDGTRDPSFLALEHEVDRRRIPRRPVRRGQRITIGALRVRILSPGQRPPGPPPADPNPRATVAVVSEHGFDLFLSADAESPALLPLRLPRVEAMKVPHHGSADAGLPALLARLRPRVAGIEAGRGNPFGHPRPSTLDALRRIPFVYRTDRDGTVELRVANGRIEVRTHR